MTKVNEKKEIEEAIEGLEEEENIELKYLHSNAIKALREPLDTYRPTLADCVKAHRALELIFEYLARANKSPNHWEKERILHYLPFATLGRGTFVDVVVNLEDGTKVSIGYFEDLVRFAAEQQEKVVKIYVPEIGVVLNMNIGDLFGLLRKYLLRLEGFVIDRAFEISSEMLKKAKVEPTKI